MEDHAIVFADTAGIIRYWSSGAEEFFGYTEAEAVGQSLDIIVPVEFRERHWAGFRAAMGTGVSRLNGAAHPGLPVQCKDGLVRQFPGRLILLRDPQGHAVGAVAVYARAGVSNPLTL
ncbi:MAG: PAS domain S-box protein [Bacteroidetes bacterium]|nr:PAS domain S-box protein [Bacteroidota bacterium]